MGSHPNYRDRYQDLLDRVAGTEPDNIVVLSALARNKLEEDTREAAAEAIRNLSRSIELGSKWIPDYELMAHLLTRSGKLGEAIDVLERGLVLNSYSGGLYRALAVSYLSSRKNSEALQVIRRGLEPFPGDSSLRMLLQKAEARTSP